MRRPVAQLRTQAIAAYIVGGAFSTVVLMAAAFGFGEPLSMAVGFAVGAVTTGLSAFGFAVALARRPPVAPGFETRLLVLSTTLGVLSLPAVGALMGSATMIIGLAAAWIGALAFLVAMPVLTGATFKLCERAGALKFIRPGHCAHCGYDLAGLDSARCPECGERR